MRPFSAAIGVLLWSAATAFAAPVVLPVLGESSVDVSATTQIEAHADNHDTNAYNDDYLAEILRLNFSLTHGETFAGLRIDGAFFQLEDSVSACEAREPLDDGVGEQVAVARRRARCENLGYLDGQDDLRPERFFLGTRLGPVRLVAGDFTARFGRGLALSVRKVDELGVDTTLRGGRVDVEAGGFTVTALAGQTNIQNLDPLNQRIVDDPIDVVAGLRIDHTLPSGINAGVHYVAYDYRLADRQTRTENGYISNDEGTHIAGASFAAPAIGGMLDLAFEADYLTDVSLVPDSGQSAIAPPVLVEGPGITERTGFALYGSASLTVGDTTLLLEGKNYRNFRAADPTRTYIAYSEPPMLERSDQQVLNNFNTLGARARLEHRFDEGRTTLFSNYLAEAHADFGADRIGSRGIAASHLYGGVERRWDSGAFVMLSTGVREESEQDPEAGKSGTVFNIAHVETDGGLPLGGGHALELKAWTWFETKAEHRFNRSTASLTYSIAPSWAFAVIYGHTSEKAVEVQPRHYWAGSLSWTVSDWLIFRAFGGRRMGGLLCVAGVCRDYPPFEGAQLAAIVQY